MQYPLPTHIHSIGQPIFDNREAKTSVQAVPFPRNPNPCPFNFITPIVMATCVEFHMFGHSMY